MLRIDTDLEKLYINFFLRDILGYIFPGSILLGLIHFSFTKDFFTPLCYIYHFKESFGILFLLFLVFSTAYVTGHLLQEIGSFLTIFNKWDGRGEENYFEAEKMIFARTTMQDSDGPHFRLYRERMHALKTLFGNLAVGSFIIVLLNFILIGGCHFYLVRNDLNSWLFKSSFILFLIFYLLHNKRSKDKEKWENRKFNLPKALWNPSTREESEKSKEPS